MTTQETALAVAPGIYFDMPASQYHAAPGLSASGMADLEVSPLRYWYLHINPDSPKDEETPALKFGTALHTRVLEPERFFEEYASELDIAEIEGVIDTVSDMREWLKARGLKPAGTLKADLAAQCRDADPEAPVLCLMEQEHLNANQGKTILSLTDWDRVHAAAGMLAREPEISRILSEAKFEVSVFAECPETGILLKARYDIWHPELTADPKSFTQKRGKSINRTIADAIVYEGYYRTAYHYARVRKLAEGGAWKPFILVFIESEMPHETRIVQLQSTDIGQANLYWQTAALKVKRLTETYADCWKRFGTAPWREPQQIAELTDEDLPQIIWER